MKEQQIGIVLRYGVLLAALILIFALIGLSIANHFHTIPTNYALSLMRWGILLLVALQLIRVMLTAVFFSSQKEWFYVGCSIFIAFGLSYSLFKCF